MDLSPLYILLYTTHTHTLYIVVGTTNTNRSSVDHQQKVNHRSVRVCITHKDTPPSLHSFLYSLGYCCPRQDGYKLVYIHNTHFSIQWTFKHVSLPPPLLFYADGPFFFFILGIAVGRPPAGFIHTHRAHLFSFSPLLSLSYVSSCSTNSHQENCMCACSW